MYWESSEDVEAILAQGYSRLRTCVPYIINWGCLLYTSATEAYYWVVENVGPVLPERDAVDKFLISEDVYKRQTYLFSFFPSKSSQYRCY